MAEETTRRWEYDVRYHPLVPSDAHSRARGPDDIRWGLEMMDASGWEFVGAASDDIISDGHRVLRTFWIFRRPYPRENVDGQ